MKFLNEGSMSDVYYTFQDIANNPDYSDADAIAQIKNVMNHPSDDSEQFVARKLKLMHDTIAKHPSYKNDPMGVYEEMLDMIRTEYHDETYESKEMNPTTQTFSEDDDTNSLEQWKADVRKQYPQQASQIKFKGKGFGDSIVAEIPGKDQAFGEFNMKTGDAWVAPMDEGVAEALDKEGDYHVSVQKGKFLPSDRGGGSDENLNYLHDLMNISGTGGGPMLVTISDPRIATEVAAMYGGKVLKTRYGTYRIVQSKGQNQKTPTPEPELVGMRESGVAEAKVIGHVGDVAGHGKVVQCAKCGTDLRDDHGFALSDGTYICRSGKCSMRQAKNRLAAMAARGEKPRWRKDEGVAEGTDIDSQQAWRPTMIGAKAFHNIPRSLEAWANSMGIDRDIAIRHNPDGNIWTITGKIKSRGNDTVYTYKWRYDSSTNQFYPYGRTGMAEATGDKRFDSMMGKIKAGATPNTPKRFIKDIKKVAKIKYKFQVGDWVTIDPNETAKWPSSGMIGRISRFSSDGNAVVNVNPGGGASGGNSSGTHTSVPTSMLEKLAVNLDEPGVAEGSEQQLGVQQLAAISDEALDKAYGYGRSSPGNTFGWQANLKSAAFAKQMIDKGVTDIEAISDAIHKGWNVTAHAFVQKPEQFDDTAKLQAAGKLEAKLKQRAQLMKQNYAELPEDEKEKDRVVARALLQALKGQSGVAEGSSSPDEYKRRLASIQSLRYDNPPEYAKQYRALLQAMPDEHAAHANQAQKGSYSPGERGSGTGSTGRVSEDSAQGTANKKAWDKGHEAGYTGNEKCPCKPGSAEEKAWNAGHKVGRDERSHERHGVKEGNMKSSENNPTGPSFAGGKLKGTDSADQAKNKYVGEDTMPSVKLMRNIAEGLVRVDDVVLNRPVYGKPTDQDRRAVYRMVREFADAGIDYNDAVIELVEYFKHELSELAVAPTIPAVGGQPATTTAPTGTPSSTTANTAAKTPDTVSSTNVVKPPVTQQGVDALAQMVKNAGLSPSQISNLMSMSKAK